MSLSCKLQTGRIRSSPFIKEFPGNTWCLDIFRSSCSRLLQNMPADAVIKKVDHLLFRLLESL